MKDSTKNILVVLMVLATCVFVGWVAPRDNVGNIKKIHDETVSKADGLRNYVDNKVLSVSKDRVSKDVTNLLSLQIEDLQKRLENLENVGIIEQLETIETLSKRLDLVWEHIDSTAINVEDKLKAEIELIKKQLEELSKREHSIVTKRYYCYPCNPCR